MFIDEAVIHVKAGNGGNGCHAYERQPFTPKGRPAGGSGGRGGHIYLAASRNIHTLQDMAYRQHYATERGMHGKGSLKTGKEGKDLTIAIPVGTVLYNDETGAVIADCINEGEPVLAARGGRGGRGNAALASPKNRNPETAEKGRPGEEKRLRLELKVLADVGLVGRPNAGKSTFLSRISRARPKIADYPFTTTEPHLGIVPSVKGRSSFVVADIPGLIEGSHTGKGLGIRFLRHIERTRALAVLIDATTPDPEVDAEILLNELSQYSAQLAERPRCLILTKSDLVPKDHPLEVPSGWLMMSAVTGDNVETVVGKLAEMVEKTRTAT
ncbi:MAG: GTPase ObgE [Chitinispirillaceae bacterium]|nr:GTPase ObgE [Chitinispirillaceae bacterium]